MYFGTLLEKAEYKTFPVSLQSVQDTGQSNEHVLSV